MKNIDKVRAMSAEELAMKVLQQNGCIFCAYNDGKCHTKDCTEGQTEWLNREVNPMPKLEVGDIVETMHYALVCVGNNILVRSATKEKKMLNDVREINRIWRFSSEGEYESIWRADNDK